MARQERMPSALSRRGLLAGSAASLIFLPRAFAQAPLPQGDLAGLVERGTLRMVMPGFSSPPFFDEEDGTGQGLDFDLARGIAAALRVGMTLERSPGTFDDAVRAVEAGEADIAVCKLSRTLSRGRVIRYSQPYARLHHGLVTNRVRFAQMAGGRPADEVIRSFSGDLGVIAHSSFAEYAPVNFPGARLHEFADWPSMIEAVRGQAIDMAYRDDFEIKKLMVDDPSLTVVARSITLTDKTDTLAVGVRPDAPHLASFVDLYLDLVRGGAVMATDEIVARYRAGRSA